MLDSREYDILSAEEVEDLKKVRDSLLSKVCFTKAYVATRSIGHSYEHCDEEAEPRDKDP